MTDSKQSDTSAFHIQLLSRIIDMSQYPLTKLIIENNLSRAEFEELLAMLDTLNKKYEIQKEEGFLDFTSLLIHFAGMLNEKLKPDQTIDALKKEGYYPSLMDEFKVILHVDKSGFRRSDH